MLISRRAFIFIYSILESTQRNKRKSESLPIIRSSFAFYFIMQEISPHDISGITTKASYEAALIGARHGCIEISDFVMHTFVPFLYVQKRGASRLQQLFSGKVDAVLTVDFHNLDLDHVADVHDVFDLFHSFFCHLGDVQQTFLARQDLDKRADRSLRGAEDLGHAALINLADLDVLRNEFDSCSSSAFSPSVP